MQENKGISFLDYLVILIKWKKFLIVLSAVVLICSYLAIYFLVTPKYDSKALIISTNNNDVGGMSSLLKSFTDLPINIPGLSPNSNMDIFTTIIYSRTTLEKIMKKFDLYNYYKLNYVDKTLEVIQNSITAEETKQGAYQVVVRDEDKNRAAEIANYIIKILNKTLININVAKAHNNSVFLAKRYKEIKTNLKMAEDSLVYYQNKSGVYLADEQAKLSIDSYAKLEAELASKQIKLATLIRIYGKNSPKVNNAKIAVEEFKYKYNELKRGNNSSGLLLSLKDIPESAMQYYRYLREVKIQTKMMEFIIPLYEQTKFDEQKEIPLIKIIDKAVPAERKAFPPRVLFSFIFTIIILGVVVFFIILKEIVNSSDNPKVKIIANSFFFLKTKSK